MKLRPLIHQVYNIEILKLKVLITKLSTKLLLSVTVNVLLQAKINSNSLFTPIKKRWDKMNTKSISRSGLEPAEANC